MESLPIFNGGVYIDDFEQTPIPWKGLADIRVGLCKTWFDTNLKAWCRRLSEDADENHSTPDRSTTTQFI